MSSMYAVYHGPEGLKAIAERVHGLAAVLARGVKRLGHELKHETFFDTVAVKLNKTDAGTAQRAAVAKGMNLRVVDARTVTVALDERTTLADVDDLFTVLAPAHGTTVRSADLVAETTPALPATQLRKTSYLQHPVFHRHRSESEMLRYIRLLESRDLSLTRSMIPLGSCTMKLNATSELVPISWPEFNGLHPFAPSDQTAGYQDLFTELERLLAECTGFARISLQPNSGAQGEYAGLLVIRRYHQARGQAHRDICLIPKSAHGTNPASAVLAGMKVVAVECDGDGNVDLEDLAKKADEHRERLAALMVTYPSTHGVFEEGISRICAIVHERGAQVYMDGANMNAQIGLCRPGDYGPDVCHLNLHKTFCIPHGGGGPGMGPIGVAAHLAPFLPGHKVVGLGGTEAAGAVSAAPWGSASILPISLMYIWMMGEPGLTAATKTAILNANYIAKRLHPHYPVLYRGRSGTVAHECIVDLRQLKARSGVEVEDVAKRLMDYGFHAPTVSFPVPGTLMIEPTESESLAELDRFCDAMIRIRKEIADIESGKASREDNLLKNAPHPAAAVTADTWTHPYSRVAAAYPAPWVQASKFWPSVARIDSAYGDRNLVCTCGPVEEYQA